MKMFVVKVFNVILCFNLDINSDEDFYLLPCETCFGPLIPLPNTYPFRGPVFTRHKRYFASASADVAIENLALPCIKFSRGLILMILPSICQRKILQNKT